VFKGNSIVKSDIKLWTDAERDRVTPREENPCLMKLQKADNSCGECTKYLKKPL